MINIITYTLIAIIAFSLSYLWLQKSYFTKMSTDNKSLLTSNLSIIFFILNSAFLIITHILIANNDYIAPLSIYQLIVPILATGLIILFPKLVTTFAACAIITYFTPQEAVTNYLPQANIYLSKFIIFAFLLTFSTLFERQNTTEGMPFINISAYGILLFIMFLTHLAPKILGLFGLFFAICSYNLFKYTKFPTKIETSKSDLRFFSVFIGWIILLSSAEYGLLPTLGVFAMFFINLLFQVFQKVKNLNIKTNYDIYNLATTKADIDENDLYTFTIKSYVIMILASLASAKSSDFKSTIILYGIFGSWFLYKSYNLYEKKASLKDIYQDIKEKVGGNKDDKSS